MAQESYYIVAAGSGKLLYRGKVNVTVFHFLDKYLHSYLLRVEQTIITQPLARILRGTGFEISVISKNGAEQHLRASLTICKGDC